jgi:hypothetical protein
MITSVLKTRPTLNMPAGPKATEAFIADCQQKGVIPGMPIHLQKAESIIFFDGIWVDGSYSSSIQRSAVGNNHSQSPLHLFIREPVTRPLAARCGVARLA